jgi:hypothetical protein
MTPETMPAGTLNRLICRAASTAMMTFAPSVVTK